MFYGFDIDPLSLPGSTIYHELKSADWRDKEEVGYPNQGAYKDACRKGQLEKSAITEHAWNRHHRARMEPPSQSTHGTTTPPNLEGRNLVIDRASKWRELPVKEMLHIQLIPKGQSTIEMEGWIYPMIGSSFSWLYT